jgi:hypothetical protein
MISNNQMLTQCMVWLLVVLGMTGCVGSRGQVVQPAPQPTSVSVAAETRAPKHVPVTPTAEQTQTAVPTPTATPTANSETEEAGMEIRLTVNDTVVTATLLDNETARDFMSLLPLTLTLEDYAGTEKISGLPKRLSTEGAPAGSDPSVGDITYYAPWGNLAIFYRDFGYASGLIILGTIDNGMEALSVPGPVTVSIERVE